MRVALAISAAIVLALGALLATGSGDEKGDSAVASAPRVQGAQGELAALYDRPSELLNGGPDAFRTQLRKLRGHPVVVNKWASWCGPCRSEFPFFRDQALARGKQIAFIGVNSSDNDANAREFLRELPVPFPSFRDPDIKVAGVFKGVAAFPTTAFYSSEGELAYVKQGSYREEKDLVADIERYAR